MLGYYRDPDLTADVMDEDGWYHTGDLAVMDQDGYVRVVGRKKYSISRGGQNIYPAEIECFLTAQPGIREAGVVGVRYKVSWEAIRALVIPKKGTDITAREVKDYCREALEAYEMPTEVRVVGNYPRAQSGKPQRYRLREHALGEMKGENRHERDAR